jgi:hypothetical protein
MYEGEDHIMRKAKSKTTAAQSEQVKDAVVSPVEETEQAAVAPEAPAQESAPEAAPAKKKGHKKAKAEAAEAEPKRLRRGKLGKAELPVRKLARKENLSTGVEEGVFVQYGGQELDVAQLKERIITAYVEAGHRRGRISKLNLYIKPEDHKAYYVINDKISGSVDL